MKNFDYQTLARTLNVGDVFHSALGLRRVVRVREVSVAMTEVLHGRPEGHPGGLVYTLFPHGARVSVPFLS